MRRLAFVLLLLAAQSTAPRPVAAQSLTGALEWLPPGSLSVQALSMRPQEALEGGEHQSFYAEFGRLAFRSPDILGGTARKAGLSCQACHANGYATTAFLIPGLSDKPGTIDVSNAFWNLRGEDGVFNPVEIPPLRGVKTKDRFGHDRRMGSLREFTRRVIVTEFAGDEPDGLLLDALVAYQERLQPAAATEAPLTLQQEFADLLRYLDALRVPLAEEEPALAGRIAVMIRSQLGFIHERFADEALHRSRSALEDWSRQLAAISDLAHAGQWPQARDRLKMLRQTVAQPPAAFAADLPRSLYDVKLLETWVSKPVR